MVTITGGRGKEMMLEYGIGGTDEEGNVRLCIFLGISWGERQTAA